MPATTWSAATSWLYDSITPEGPPEPLTWGNAFLAHTHMILYLHMAYLTRRPNTRRTRLLVLPLVVIITLHCTTHYHLESPRLRCLNWLRGLSALVAIGHSLYFASLTEGVLKVDEDSRHASDRHEPNGVALVACEDAMTPADASFLPACVYDALEVAFALRGIGWRFSHGMQVPRTRRPLDRRQFLQSTSLSVLKTYLTVDLIVAILNMLPGITVTGGTIFYMDLPPIPRYTVSTALHICAGLFVIFGLSMGYNVLSLVAVGFFHQSPSLWPPFHDEPWRVSSLHEFWSKRWHQALRHTFLVYGGYPGRWLAGDIGMLLGTFLASGLFHEVGLYLGGETMDVRVIWFFLVQPFGILAEKSYRVITGKRVGGWLGWTWAVIFIVGFGQVCTDAWVGRGAGGMTFVPPTLSPARQLILPAVRRVVAHSRGGGA
ncbi:hypothetical protein C8Q80DRAFT_1169337 [Daedaleopsis nitida]|nr:hypothetical protein C8Q80DRAFT_1169337 [Daedaleopsis nitida]